MTNLLRKVRNSEMFRNLAVGSALAFALLLSASPVGYTLDQSGLALQAQVAQAACPAVPADCTIDDVIGDTADSVFDTTVATLVSNLPAIVAGATILMVGFALIKLVFRWARKFIH